jgi:predicted phage gp36 major capsid-like protein
MDNLPRLCPRVSTELPAMIFHDDPLTTVFNMIHGMPTEARQVGYFATNDHTRRFLCGLYDDEGDFIWKSREDKSLRPKLAGYPVYVLEGPEDEEYDGVRRLVFLSLTMSLDDLALNGGPQ